MTEKDRFETRTIGLLVAPQGESIFSDCITEIRIDDDAAGEYVVVRQNDRPDNSIAITPDEWPTIRAAIDQMIAACREEDQ